MSYEQLLGEPIPELEKIDVWSLGIILYEIIYGKHPYITQQEGVQLNQLIIAKRIEEKKIQFPDSKYDNQVIDLLKGMLQTDYKKRFSIKQCIQHSFLN
ncbi:unnamed protein product [Paramecium sonneborni]|uniref:Protein kinase domain-containing protein n=1 Tax=Paramecium sonneborni TaxID=65129 RepID=A0A8S1N067_9CILI|nr:unnamed protein product [Paramecium sonneborni]